MATVCWPGSNSVVKDFEEQCRLNTLLSLWNETPPQKKRGRKKKTWSKEYNKEEIWLACFTNVPCSAVNIKEEATKLRLGKAAEEEP